MKRYTAVLILLVSINLIYGAPHKCAEDKSPFWKESPECVEEDKYCGGFGGPVDQRYGPLRLCSDLKEEAALGAEEEIVADDEKRDREVAALFAAEDKLILYVAEHGTLTSKGVFALQKKIYLEGKNSCWRPDFVIGDVINARDATGRTVLDVLVSKVLNAYNKSNSEVLMGFTYKNRAAKVCMVRSRLEPLVQLLRAGGLPSIENLAAVAQVRRIFYDFMCPSSQSAVRSRCNRAHEAQLMPEVLRNSILALPSSIYDLVAGYLDDLIMVESDPKEVRTIKQAKHAAFAWQKEALGLRTRLANILKKVCDN